MTRTFDLRDRTLRFAKDVVALTKSLGATPANIEFCRQLIRSAASIGANYIEANDALGVRDFLMKIRTARREANETRYWLELLECDEAIHARRDRLLDEASQLGRIFSSIIIKMENRRGSR